MSSDPRYIVGELVEVGTPEGSDQPRALIHCTEQEIAAVRRLPMLQRVAVVPLEVLNGGARSVKRPLGTVPTHDRFGLVRPEITVDGERYRLEIRFRMLQPRELAAAQGFHPGYRFAGTKTEQVKQIGNAVPRNLARALVLAALGQRSDVAELMRAAA